MSGALECLTKRAKTQAIAKALIRNAIKLAGIGAWAFGKQDALGDRLKVGEKMDRTFYGNDGLCGGVNAEMSQNGLVGGLGPP